MQNKFKSTWDMLTSKISNWANDTLESLPNLLIAWLVFAFFYWLAHKMSAIIDALLKKRIKKASVRAIISKIASFLIMFAGLMMALSVLDLDDAFSTLLTGAGIAGITLSLALQGTLANTLSGLYLALTDIVQQGHWIESNGYAGEVVEINLKNLKLKEIDNNIVIIPNRLIVEKPFKNFSLTNKIRTTISCRVAYDSDLENTKKIAIKTIQDLFPKEKGEDVELYFNNFGETSIEFILRFWVNATENLPATEVKSKAIIALKIAFEKNGIEIPLPIKTIIQKNKKLNK